MRKFTSIIAAALLCGSMSAMAQDVKVTPAIDENTFEPAFQFNKDYHYYTISLDEETQAANLTDDQVTYIGADPEQGRNLWLWATSSSFVDPTGTNSFNVPGNYITYRVGTDGWSGIGYNVAAANPIDLSGITDEYTFHMAVKSTSNEVFEFYLTDLNDHQANIVLGTKPYDDKDPIADFNRDGEWYNIDIPMSYLEDNFGFSFKGASNYADKNLLCLLAGGVEGTEISYDAVFFYGPKTSTGVNNILTNDNIAAKEVFTMNGTKVSSDYAKANKGIYVVKQGNKVSKVATR